jgi:hypothetical protein
MNYRLSSKSRLFFVLSFTLLVIFSLPLSAQTPPGGYDLLQTGSGAAIDLSSAGLGNVALQGVPIQTSTGSTDTIMHRTQNVSGTNPIPVEVTAIFMKSANSVTFMGQSVDVYVTLNNSAGNIPTSVVPQPDALSASGGNVTPTSGSTFNSSITVNADVIFVKAGTSVTNSANYVAHQPAPAITLTSSASTYSSAPPSGYPSSTTYPSGGFYPRPVHTGPHPVIPSTCNPPNSTQPISGAVAKGGSQPQPQFAVKACLTSAIAQ